MAKTTPEFDGRLDEMYAIFLENLLFTIVTLGLYRSWAKTRVRRYLTGHMSVMGDRLEYTGTGWELFRAFLLVFFFLYAPFIAAIGWSQLTQPPEIAALVFAVVLILAIILTPFARFTGLRYRMTRTQWRGVRCGLVGSPWGYVGKYLLVTLVLLVALAIVVALIAGLAFAVTAIGVDDMIAPVTALLVPIPASNIIIVGLGALIAFVAYGVLTPTSTVWLERYRLDRMTFGDLQGAFGARWRDAPCLSLVIALPLGLLIYIAIWVVIALIAETTGLNLLILEILLPFILALQQGVDALMRLSFAQIGPVIVYYVIGGAVSIVILIVSFYGPVAWHLGRFYRFIAGNWGLGEDDGPYFAPPPHPWSYAKLLVGNLLIRIFTLGLGAPLVWRRNMRFLARVAILNAAALENAAQGQQRRGAAGEGLLDAMDIGVV